MGTSIIAASVDTAENAETVAAELQFPVGQGVTRETADSIGAWWEDRRSIVQPSEFILDKEGNVVLSTYSSGPIGRIAPDSVVRLVTFYRSR